MAFSVEDCIDKGDFIECDGHFGFSEFLAINFNKPFIVNGDLEVLDDFSSKSTIEVKGNVEIHGNAYIGGDFVVNGAVYIEGLLEVKGKLKTGSSVKISKGIIIG